jgi:5,6-dimethylbenzimidazole synthase
VARRARAGDWHGLDFDPRPKKIAALLDVPPQWKFIGYFCLGYPENQGTVPELEQLGWEERQPSTSFIIRR